jgi:hypothetical protein
MPTTLDRPLGNGVSRRQPPHQRSNHTPSPASRHVAYLVSWWLLSTTTLIRALSAPTPPVCASNLFCLGVPVPCCELLCLVLTPHGCLQTPSPVAPPAERSCDAILAKYRRMSGDSGQGKSTRLDFMVYSLAQQHGLPSSVDRQCFKMVAGLVGELCTSLRETEKECTQLRRGNPRVQVLHGHCLPSR